MFDIFGRKRIRDLEHDIAIQNGQLDVAAEIASDLRRQLREQDEKIWMMSQCTDWKSMQPIFAKILDETNYRKQMESRRIGSIINSELNKGAY